MGLGTAKAAELILDWFLVWHWSHVSRWGSGWFEPFHWKAIKKLRERSKEKRKVIKQWLVKQAFWQVHLPPDTLYRNEYKYILAGIPCFQIQSHQIHEKETGKRHSQHDRHHLQGWSSHLSQSIPV